VLRTKSASEPKDERPNAPTVKAMALKAAIGAYRMTIAITPNSAADSRSIVSSILRPFSPIASTAAPNRTAKNMICSTSACTKAPKTLSGTMFRKKSRTECSLATPENFSTTARWDSVGAGGDMCEPGWKRLPATSPTTRATVVTTSK
jgi:hypothetical protein